MRHVLSLLSLCAVAVVVTPACSRKVPPPPPPVVVPDSGWTATDTDEVTRTLVDACAGHTWVAEFRERQGRMPVVEVAGIEDRTADHVPVSALAEALRTRLERSNAVLAATAGQVADARLTGVVSMRGTSLDGKPVQLYQVDLKIVDMRTNDQLWWSGVERSRRPTGATAPVVR